MLKFLLLALGAYLALHFFAPASLTGGFVIPGKVIAALAFAAVLGWLLGK